jgi:zinc protease
VYQRDSVFYQAMQLGELATLGLPLDLLEKRVDKLKAVTAEQVKTAARLLADEQLSVAVLDPQPVASQPRKPAMEGVNHVR